jgi:hypothetical protein
MGYKALRLHGVTYFLGCHSEISLLAVVTDIVESARSIPYGGIHLLEIMYSLQSPHTSR